MPNTGRPSRDCHSCRKRRVKCDLKRPGCDRCLRIGKICPGYREETSLLFRHEDLRSLSGPSSDRRRRTTSSERHETGSSGSSTPLDLSRQASLIEDASFLIPEDKLQLTDRLILSQDSGTDSHLVPINEWAGLAPALVLSMFSLDMDGQRDFGNISFLPKVLATSPSDGPITLCCNALAFAFLANKACSFAGFAARDEAYGKALAATNKLVGDEWLCQEDETAICAWLLSFYELVSHSNGEQEEAGAVSWNVHALGLASLLRVRGPSQLNTMMGQQVFWQLATAAQVQAFVNGTPYPVYIQPWLDQLSSTAISDLDRNLQLTRFAVKAASLLAKTKTHRVSLHVHIMSASIQDINDLWTEASSLNDLCSRLLTDDGITRQSLLVRADVRTIHFDNQYRICYVEVLQALLDLVQSYGSQQEELYNDDTVFRVLTQVNAQYRASVSAVLKASQLLLNQDTVNQTRQGADVEACPICWSDGLKLLWPLRSIASRKSLLEEWQVQSVGAALYVLSTRFSIRYAIAPFS